MVTKVVEENKDHEQVKVEKKRKHMTPARCYRQVYARSRCVNSYGSVQD